MGLRLGHGMFKMGYKVPAGKEPSLWENTPAEDLLRVKIIVPQKAEEAAVTGEFVYSTPLVSDELTTLRTNSGFFRVFLRLKVFQLKEANL